MGYHDLSRGYDTKRKTNYSPEPVPGFASSYTSENLQHRCRREERRPQNLQRERERAKKHTQNLQPEKSGQKEWKINVCQGLDEFRVEFCYGYPLSYDVVDQLCFSSTF